MSWMWNVLGSNQASGSASQPAEPAKSESSADSADWREGVNQYWCGVRSSFAGSGADSGFAIIDKVLGKNASGANAIPRSKKDMAYGRGNSAQELADIEAMCNTLSNPSQKSSGAVSDDEIWNEWLKRIETDKEDRFYDSDADELLSFHQLIVSSSAVGTTVRRVLECRKDASPDSPAVKFLSACMIGESAAKARVLAELTRLGQVIDGTRTSEKLVSIICNVISTAKMDLRCEDRLKQVADLMAQVREKEMELKALPNVDSDEQNLRDRVLRSAEMLDKNATMRHMIVVASSLVEERMHHGQDRHVLEQAEAEVQRLSDVAKQENALALQLSEAAIRERETLESQLAEREAELSHAEDDLNATLEGLLARKRELEEALERVMGEILSVDMRLNDTRRERATVARRTAQRSQGLLEQIQALSVQVQDYENEVDAADDTANFVAAVQRHVDATLREQAAAARRGLSQVWEDQTDFLMLHLRHQTAQLGVLGSTLAFCEEELASTKARLAREAKLPGMAQLVNEDVRRQRHLETKRVEAAERVQAIEQDLEDMRTQLAEARRAGAGAAGDGGSGGPQTSLPLQGKLEEVDRMMRALHKQLVEVRGILGVRVGEAAAEDDAGADVSRGDLLGDEHVLITADSDGEDAIDQKQVSGMPTGAGMRLTLQVPQHRPVLLPAANLPQATGGRETAHGSSAGRGECDGTTAAGGSAHSTDAQFDPCSPAIALQPPINVTFSQLPCPVTRSTAGETAAPGESTSAQPVSPPHDVKGVNSGGAHANRAAPPPLPPRPAMHELLSYVPAPAQGEDSNRPVGGPMPADPACFGCPGGRREEDSLPLPSAASRPEHDGSEGAGGSDSGRGVGSTQMALEDAAVQGNGAAEGDGGEGGRIAGVPDALSMSRNPTAQRDAVVIRQAVLQAADAPAGAQRAVEASPAGEGSPAPELLAHGGAEEGPACADSGPREEAMGLPTPTAAVGRGGGGSAAQAGEEAVAAAAGSGIGEEEGSLAAAGGEDAAGGGAVDGSCSL